MKIAIWVYLGTERVDWFYTDSSDTTDVLIQRVNAKFGTNNWSHFRIENEETNGLPN